MSVLDKVNSIVNSRISDDEKLEKFAELYDGDITSSLMSSDIDAGTIQSKRGEFLATMNEDFVKTEGIDWGKGMPQLFRGGLARADTLEEREKYLTDTVGEGGWYREGEEFVIKKDRLEPFGMKSERDVGIDPAGFDWGDINPVGDAAGIALPLATAAGAGIASTGLGSGLGMLAVGGAAAGGKAIDESIEYLRGRNLQTGPQVLGDIATEGALAATGEGLVRGLGAGVRYFIGGPGRKMRVLDQATGEYIKPKFWGRRGKAYIIEDKEHMQLVDKLIDSGFSLDADQILPRSYPGFYTKLQKAATFLFGDPRERNVRLITKMLDDLGYGGALKKEPMKDVHNVADRLRGLVDNLSMASSKEFKGGKDALRSGLVASIDDMLEQMGGKEIQTGSGNFFRDALVDAHHNAKELASAHYAQIDDILKANGIQDSGVVAMSRMEDQVLQILKETGRPYGGSGYRLLNGRTKELMETILGTEGKTAPRVSFQEAHAIRSDMISESFNPEIGHRTLEQGLLTRVSDLLTKNMSDLKPLGAAFGPASIDGVQVNLQGVSKAGLKELGTAFNKARSFYKGYKDEFDYFKLGHLLTQPDDAVKSSDQIARLLINTKNVDLAEHAKNILGGKFGARVGETAFPKTSYKPQLKEVGSFRDVRRAYTKEMFGRLARPDFPDGVKSGQLLNELKSMATTGTEQKNLLDLIYGKKLGRDLMSFAKQMDSYNAPVGPELVKKLDTIMESGSGWEGKFTRSLNNYRNVAREKHLIDSNIFLQEFRKPQWAEANGTKMVEHLWKPANETKAKQAMAFIRNSDDPIYKALEKDIKEMGPRQFLVENMVADGVDGLSGTKLKMAMNKFSPTHLEALMGKDHVKALTEFADTLQVVETSKMSFSSIATSALPIHPLSNKGLFMKLAVVGNLLSSPTMMRYISKGFMNNDMRAVMEGLSRAGMLSGGHAMAESGEPQKDRAELMMR